MTDVQATCGTSTTRPAPRQRFRAAADIAEGTDRSGAADPGRAEAARAPGAVRRGRTRSSTTWPSATDEVVGPGVPRARSRCCASAGDPDAGSAALRRRGSRSAVGGQARRRCASTRCAHAGAGRRAGRPARRRPTAPLEVALALAATTAARDWDASLLNNIGMVHADAGDFADALVGLRAGPGGPRADRRPRADSGSRRWMVAWALRNLGRTSDALAMQRETEGRARRGGPHRPARRRRAGRSSRAERAGPQVLAVLTGLNRTSRKRSAGRDRLLSDSDAGWRSSGRRAGDQPVFVR